MVIKLQEFIRRNLRYIVIGVLLFIGFVYLRFPVERYRDGLEASIAKVVPNTNVTIGGLSTTLLPGVALEDVRIESTISGAVYKVDRMRLRFHLMSILLRKMSVGFSVKSQALTVSGNLSRGILGRDFMGVEVDVDSVNLTQLFTPGFLNEVIVGNVIQQMVRGNPMLGGMVAGIKLQGALSGNFALSGGKKEMETMDLSALEGELQLDGSKMNIEGVAPGGLDTGTLDVDWSLDKGKGELAKLELKGKDLMLSGKGTMKFEKPPQTGNMSLEMQLRVPETARPNIAGSLNLFLMGLGIEIRDNKAAFKVGGSLGGRVPPRITPMN